MGALTGVALRALRALILARSSSTVATASAIVLGAIVLFGMLSLYLSNFPVRRWLRRVLAFAGAEISAELCVSAALVALGRERLGTTGRAEWADLPTIALTILEWRVVPLALFAFVLALVVQIVRRMLPRHTPEHTAQHAAHHTPPSVP
jgi:hypothetical protein